MSKKSNIWILFFFVCVICKKRDSDYNTFYIYFLVFFMFSRLFRYAFTNIMRNSFLSFSSVLVLTLLMFFINTLLLVHDVSFKIIDGINERLTISLYLKDGYDKNSWDVIDLLAEIRKDLPNVRSTYKTKDDIIDELREEDPELVNILERQNPLPETISLTNIDLSQFEKLNYIIQGRSYILSESEEKEKDRFSSYSSQYDRIVSITVILNVLQIWLYIIIGIFLFSIAIIIYSIIWNFIYYFRDEIYITRLVWGSKVFIYGPFSLQGAIYSFVAFILSLVIFLLFLQGIEVLFETNFWDNGVLTNITFLLIIECVVCVVIWALSWFLSSRKYLK